VCRHMFFDELSSRWSDGRIQTSPDSSKSDSFNAMPIICRREAPPGAGRVQQFGENDGSVDSLQGQVVIPRWRNTLMTCSDCALFTTTS